MQIKKISVFLAMFFLMNSPVVFAKTVFIEKPGEKELSHRLLVMPKTIQQLMQEGLSVTQAHAKMHSVKQALVNSDIKEIAPLGIHVLAVPSNKQDARMADELMRTGNYAYVEPDWIVYPNRIANVEPSGDPNLSLQWHLHKINAPSAWSVTTGNPNMIIAFVDTGVEVTHPDLVGSLVPGLNAVSQLPQAQGGLVNDVNGHGTSTAGTAAAMGNNGIGGSGVGWNLKIMPVRATNFASGGAFTSDIMYGACWAALNGAKVVSISYAGVESAGAQSVGAYIRSRGASLVWAAGNTAVNSSAYDHPDVIVVGGTDQTDQLWWSGLHYGSNYGRIIDVVAPAPNIHTTMWGNSYGYNTGTSFSAPIVSGVLAMILSANPALSPYEAERILFNSANDLGTPGEDDTFGRGRVNLSRAVSVAAIDFNNDGLCNVGDFSAFLNAFAVNDPRADMDHSRFFTANDFAVFQNTYVGCH